MGEPFMHYHSNQFVRDYQDRGMAKWMGFYLSEHTSEMRKADQDHLHIFPRREAMDEHHIFEVLTHAFENKETVNIQLNFLNAEGYSFEDKIGVIEGYEGNKIYLLDETGTIQIIYIDSISNLFVQSSMKWSELK